jgi:hypothetical protein
MKIDLEKGVVELQTRKVEIPRLVIEAMQDEFDVCDEHLAESNQFLKTLGVNRIGFNGLKVDNYYEFIFKVDGDKFLDSHSERHEANTIIDSVAVRIGSPSDLAILVIGCKNPLMKSYYVNNDMFHYISISFSCEEAKVAAILQYAEALINKVLSKGASYLTPDDVFKPESDSDDLYFDQPSLTDLISEFKSFHKSIHTSDNDYKLYQLIANSYNLKDDLRFIPYFKILEYLSRNQKIANSESRFSKFLSGMSDDFKQEVVSKVDGNIVFDDMVEYIRATRNVLTHPAAKYKKGTVFYPFKKSVAFQRALISKIVGFEL